MPDTARAPLLAILAVLGASLAAALGAPALTAACVAPTPPAAAQGCEAWRKAELGEVGRNVDLEAMAVDPTGRRVFVSLAEYPTAGGIVQPWLVAYDLVDGEELWRTDFGCLALCQNIPRLAISPDGDAIFYATTWARIVKVDAATGEVVWRRDLGEPYFFWGVRSVRVASDGGLFYVLGEERGDLVLAALETRTGSVVWSVYEPLVARSGAPGFAGATTSRDERTIYLAATQGAGAGSDIVTLAYDALTGDRRWKRVLDGPDGRLDEAAGVALSADGGKVFVTGLTQRAQPNSSTTHYDQLTVAYDSADGSTRWTRVDGSPMQLAFTVNDVPGAIAAHPQDDKVYVTTSVWRLTADARTIAYDGATGAELWRTEHPGMVEPRFALVAPDGERVLVAGMGDDGEGWADKQFHTVALDASTGARRWHASAGTPASFDYVTSAALTRDGERLLLGGTGVIPPSGPTMALTMAYDTAMDEELLPRASG